MTLPREFREKAFALYCMDVTLEEATRLLGMRNRATICHWSRKYGWTERKREMLRLARESSTISTEDKHKRILETIMALFAAGVSENRNKMVEKTTNKDVMEAIKLYRLLIGQSTENIAVLQAVLGPEVDEIYERFKRQLGKPKAAEAPGDAENP